jgi:SAM-dependent methyltransferase
MKTDSINKNNDKYDVRENQSIELLKELHILTRDGKMNQDSRRKLKQVFHLVQFIEPIIGDLSQQQQAFNLVDFGAGKSYLGFLLYDLIAKHLQHPFQIIGIDLREDLVQYSQELAQRVEFKHMLFYQLNTQEALVSADLPQQIDIVTALHACNTATDDAINFALHRNVPYIVLVPCCQAEVAGLLKEKKSKVLKNNYFSALWKFPIHTREFGSHLTNVMRCLFLESCGYEVTVTELVGWEHSMKNELIIAKKLLSSSKSQNASAQLKHLLLEFNLEALAPRFKINL